MTNFPWKEITAQLDKLGVALTEGAKKGAEFLWPLAVKQTLVQGILGLLGYLVSATVLILYVTWLFKALKSGKFDYENDLSEGEQYAVFGIAIVGGIVSFISLVALFSNIDSLLVVLNPQWYALQHISDLLKTVKP